MDGEQKFWISVWSLAAGCVCAVVLSATVYNLINMMEMNDAIAHAADPVAMSCAMGDQQSCIARR